MKSNILEHLKDYKLFLLKILLSTCSEKEISLFNKMYGSVDIIPDDKIDWAIQQCENTIVKNKLKLDDYDENKQKFENLYKDVFLLTCSCDDPNLPPPIEICEICKLKNKIRNDKNKI